MYPILFRIGDIEVPSFTVFAILAMFSAMAVVRSEARRYGWNVTSMSWLTVHCTVVGFLASHLLYAFTRRDLPWDEWWKIVIDIGYGNVWYGGFFASWLLCFFYAKKNKLDIWKMFDLGALCIIPAQAVGRIGCFFNGCCYGKPTDLFWGMKLNTYEYGLQTVHPTNLYETLYLGFVFILLWNLRKKHSYSGKTAILYCVFAPIGRFLIEFLRGDTVRGFVFNTISTSQFIALLVLLAALIMLKKKKSNS